MKNNIKISNELKSQFLRLYQLALVDSDFSPLEWKMLYNFAAERGIEKNELDKILLNPLGKMEIPEDIETRLIYLIDFAQLIWVDGIVTEDEINTLKKFCSIFEFLDENIEELSSYLINSVKEGKSKNDILNELMQR
jgi:uncharacterized tellurite resistance protein B-like protein